ncbi:MAG: isochorismatase family protein [Gammaproteobacteria bacterium]
MKTERLVKGDALLIIHVQNDFLPGGNLPVPGGDRVIPVINKYIEMFVKKGYPIFATRDWHPPDHSSFIDQGGQWPPHCVAGSQGAEYSPDLLLPEPVPVISTGTDNAHDGYSGFVDTTLKSQLDRAGVKRLFVAGLATDYCVLNTVLDALKLNYTVFLLRDGIRAVQTETGKLAELTMQANGAKLITIASIL